MQYSDLHVVQADRIGGVLKVDQVRELQHSLALTPYEGRYRLALLMRFDEAHLSASNALLKTLEEPNPHVILVLTAENPDHLLPTIVSRCEIIRLRPAPVDALTTILADHLHITTEDARFLSHISNGRAGTAIQYHQNPDLVEKRAEMLEDLCALLSANRVERLSYAENLAKDSELTRQTLLTWMLFWRDILLKTTASSTSLTHIDLEPTIEALAARLDRSTAFKMIQEIDTTLKWIDRNINLRLALEVMLLNMPKLPEKILT
jgi:DNA polymerase-3 subunit delta'